MALRARKDSGAFEKLASGRLNFAGSSFIAQMCKKSVSERFFL